VEAGRRMGLLVGGKVFTAMILLVAAARV
jgi:hypothetical protein